MRILFFNWGYTKLDMKEALDNLGINYDQVGYSFGDKNNDDFFEYRFSRCLDACCYDAVLSVNFFPLIAKCCYRKNIKYISWSYDNPLNVTNIEDTLSLPTSFVFLFDRVQAQQYSAIGGDRVFHMPLAVNTKRLDKIVMTEAEKTRFSSEISFVGKLYDSEYGLYQKLMNDFQKGYCDSIIKAQGNLYGCYILDSVISDEFVAEINDNALKTYPNFNACISKESLVYAMAAQTTKEERLTFLSLLKNHFQVKLYSREWNDILKGVEFLGSCGYLEEMPRIFRASKVNLNISFKMIQSGIPLRCLDVMGAGGFLVSNYQPELLEFFEAGKEFVMYEDVGDAFEKIKYYLCHDDVREKIALAGHTKAANEFSYELQLKRIFKLSGLM